VFDELADRLDEVEGQWRDANRGKAAEEKVGGALVVTSDIPKFFSNGLSDPELLKNADFVNSEAGLFSYTILKPADTLPDVFDRVNYRLLTFPLVTVAAVNGHGRLSVVFDRVITVADTPAFAGGMITALCCDYRLASTARSFWSLNEVSPHAQPESEPLYSFPPC
jgi:enoyl-CoA hydratase/carnithine racemase